MILRILEKTIQKSQKPGFITLIYGPRRVGKTVFLNEYTRKIPPSNLLWFNGDTEETQRALSSTSAVALTQLVQNIDTIVIDEAQRIPNIGLSLKILIDTFPQKKFYVTGSSSLILTKGLQESLTGRTITHKLYPLSTQELTESLPIHQKSAVLAAQLIYGGYPYLQNLHTEEEKKQYLKSLISDYLLKDILSLQEISHQDILKKLAILLAFQIGSEVSLNELSRNLGIDVKTVARYLFLLEQSFLIFPLGSYAKNLRNELTKSKKYYFWDVGIRNALIDQFLPLDSRTDVGQLWENFLAVERLKKHEYALNQIQTYFWRTYEKQEIDWIEIGNEKLSAFEFHFKDQKVRTPKAFLDTYHEKVVPISQANYLDFVI
ncbi:ATP-binding protein [Candidatus Gottesmanbacteria bacterium]|nr:ATP-binding protein [Candidatus Gottesmanbacteria bacterium]